MKQRKFGKLERRTFLGGAAVALSLPFLPSMFGARAAMAAPASAPRFLVYYVPNGMHLQAFTPSTTGTGFALSPILQPLEPVRSEISVLSGLRLVPELVTSGHHINGGSSLLTYTLPSHTDLVLATSVDQVIAQHLGGETALSSLQLRVAGDTNPAACNDGIDCAYTDTISWAGPRAPLAPLTDVAVAFDQFFAGSDPTASDVEQERRRALKSSVLDVVLDQATTLRTRLGTHDQRKLDEWLESIRTVEREIQAGAVPATGGCQPPAELGPTTSFQHEVELMGDLMALAFECDLTRVITFQMGRTGSDRNYSFAGVSGNHHAISHHGNKLDNLAALTVIDTWEIQMYSRLLQRLNAATDVDGQSILHNSLVFLTTDVGDGDTHTQFEVPAIMAGRLGGKLEPGHHLQFDGQVNHGNVYIALMQALGIERSEFGQGAIGPAPLPFV